MTEISDRDRETVCTRRQTMTSRREEVRAWFIQEVLPLEMALTKYLQANWRGQAGIGDVLHDVYVKVIDAARKEFPVSAAPFVFTIARNLLIDRVRQEKVVPFEAVENLEALNIAADSPAPDEQVIAREELRRIQGALDRLHPKSREAFVLYHIEGLSRAEIAVRLGITEHTVGWYLNAGVRLLADILYRGSQDRGQPA
jgi:RNA polymerase sigma factor (sigma-70 family)